MEIKPQNPEFSNNPENFHPCIQASTWDFGTYPKPPAAKAHTSLHICTVWKQPPLLPNTN